MSEPEKAARPGAVIREMYDRFNRGDFEGSTAMLHEDVVLYQWREIPDSDTYVGRDQFLRAITRWLAGFVPGFRFDIEDVREEEGRVLLRVRIAGRGRASGAALEQIIFHVWEVRDGKGHRIRVFSREDEALLALREQS